MDLKPAMLNTRNMQIAIVASFILQPFEVLQTSMIATQYSQKNINFHGLRLLCSNIIAKEGFRGFFRGTTLSIVKNTLAYSLFFTGIENFRYHPQLSDPLRTWECWARLWPTSESPQSAS